VAFHKLESKHTHGKIVIDVDASASAQPSAKKGEKDIPPAIGDALQA
jgi:hypothetical protein